MADVFIIEDDLTLRSHIEDFLNRGGHTVSVAGDGEEAIQALENLICDVIVTDVKLPKQSGIEVLRRITQRFSPPPPVVLMTGHGDKQMAIDALRNGACDFLEKPFHPQLLVQTLERVLAEKKADIARFRAGQSNATQSDLTGREKEIGTLAAQGLSNEEIAHRLSIGAETVKTHLKSVFRKMGVSNRTALSARWHSQLPARTSESG